MPPQTFQGPLPNPLEPLIASSVWGIFCNIVILDAMGSQSKLDRKIYGSNIAEKHARPLLFSALPMSGQSRLKRARGETRGGSFGLWNFFAFNFKSVFSDSVLSSEASAERFGARDA